MEMEYWKTIHNFWDYKVSSYGRVFNKHGREMVLSPTMNGDLTVGLVKDGHQFRRSVKVLVARAFVDGEDKTFNTPIQCDGDKHNLYAYNILWRPRWFAWQYARQFQPNMDWFYYGPILNVMTQMEYTNILNAAISNGNLCKDIYLSIMSGKTVFPDLGIYIFTNE
jgi:hypothetical protein